MQSGQAAPAHNDHKIRTVVSKIFSSLRRDMDTIMNSAEGASCLGQYNLEQQQAAAGTAAAADLGCPVLRLHGRTQSEEPGHYDFALPDPVCRLPDVLEEEEEEEQEEPMHGSRSAGQTVEATSPTMARRGPQLPDAALLQDAQFMRVPANAAALQTAPAALQDTFPASPRAVSCGRAPPLSYRELLDRALSWNPLLKHPDARRTDEWQRRSTGSTSFGGGKSTSSSSGSLAGRAAAIGGSHKLAGLGGYGAASSRGGANTIGSSRGIPPSNMFSELPSPSGGCGTVDGSQAGTWGSGQQRAASAAGRGAGRIFKDSTTRPASAGGAVQFYGGNVPGRSSSAPRDASPPHRYPARRLSASPVKAPGRGNSGWAQTPQQRRQQQQQQQQRLRASLPSETGVERLYHLGVERQTKRVQAPRPASLSSLRLSEDDWARVTSRLYHDAEVKEVRLQQRRVEEAQRLQGLSSVHGRSRSASPSMGTRRSHAGGSQSAGSSPDRSFHSRQAALLRKRAELAARRRPSDDEDMEECTFHPKINPVSRSLQRSVQQLHLWDARRKLSVYEKALDRAETGDEEYTFVPTINPLSRALALANYAVAPDPARPWTSSPKHTHGPPVVSPQRSIPSPEAIRIVRDAMPPPHILALAGASRQHTAASAALHARASWSQPLGAGVMQQLQQTQHQAHHHHHHQPPQQGRISPPRQQSSSYAGARARPAASMHAQQVSQQQGQGQQEHDVQQQQQYPLASHGAPTDSSHSSAAASKHSSAQPLPAGVVLGLPVAVASGVPAGVAGSGQQEAKARWQLPVDAVVIQMPMAVSGGATAAAAAAAAGPANLQQQLLQQREEREDLMDSMVQRDKPADTLLAPAEEAAGTATGSAGIDAADKSASEQALAALPPLQPPQLTALRLTPVQAQRGLEAGQAKHSLSGAKGRPSKDDPTTAAVAASKPQARDSSSGGMAPCTPPVSGAQDRLAAAQAHMGYLDSGPGHMLSSPLSRPGQQANSGTECMPASTLQPEMLPLLQHSSSSFSRKGSSALGEKWLAEGQQQHPLVVQTVPAYFYASQQEGVTSPRTSSYSKRYQQKLGKPASPPEAASGGGNEAHQQYHQQQQQAHRLLQQQQGMGCSPGCGQGQGRGSSSCGGAYAGGSDICGKLDFAQLKAAWQDKERSGSGGRQGEGSGDAPSSPRRSPPAGASPGQAAFTAALEQQQVAGGLPLARTLTGTMGPGTPTCFAAGTTAQPTSGLGAVAAAGTAAKQYSTAQLLNAQRRASMPGGLSGDGQSTGEQAHAAGHDAAARNGPNGKVAVAVGAAGDGGGSVATTTETVPLHGLGQQLNASTLQATLGLLQQLAAADASQRTTANTASGQGAAAAATAAGGVRASEAVLLPAVHHLLPGCSSVLSVPDTSAVGLGGVLTAESCNGTNQQQQVAAAKVEGLLEQTRSVPFELVLSPRSKQLVLGRGVCSGNGAGSGGSAGGGSVCIDPSSALGQQVLALLSSAAAAATHQQQQQHLSGVPATATAATAGSLPGSMGGAFAPATTTAAAVWQVLTGSPWGSTGGLAAGDPEAVLSGVAAGAPGSSEQLVKLVLHPEGGPSTACLADSSSAPIPRVWSIPSGDPLALVQQQHQLQQQDQQQWQGQQQQQQHGSGRALSCENNSHSRRPVEEGVAPGGVGCSEAAAGDSASQLTSGSCTAPAAAAPVALIAQQQQQQQQQEWPAVVTAPEQQQQHQQLQAQVQAASEDAVGDDLTDASSAKLAAELVALMSPGAAGLSPEEQAQRMARTLAKTLSRLNMPPEVLQQSMAQLEPSLAPPAPPAAAAVGPAQPVVHGATLAAAPATSAMDDDLSGADSMQQLLERVSNGGMLLPTETHGTRQQQQQQQQQQGLPAASHQAAVDTKAQVMQASHAVIVGSPVAVAPAVAPVEEFPSLLAAASGAPHAARLAGKHASITLAPAEGSVVAGGGGSGSAAAAAPGSPIAISGGRSHSLSWAAVVSSGGGAGGGSSAGGSLASPGLSRCGSSTPSQGRT